MIGQKVGLNRKTLYIYELLFSIAMLLGFLYDLTSGHLKGMLAWIILVCMDVQFALL